MSPSQVAAKFYLGEISLPQKWLTLLGQLPDSALYPKIVWRPRYEQAVWIGLGASAIQCEIPTQNLLEAKSLCYFGVHSFDNKTSKESWERFPQTLFWAPFYLIKIFPTRAELFCQSYRPSHRSPSFINQLWQSSYESPCRLKKSSRQDDPKRPQWIELVEKARQQMAESKLRKVVLARQTSFSYEGDAVLALLAPFFRQRTLSLFAIAPTAEHWFLGASPETLYQRSEQRLLIDALASSCPIQSNRRALDRWRHSKKEKLEHQYVKEGIEQQLSGLVRCPQWLDRDKIVTSANLYHRYNRYHSDIKLDVHDDSLIDALHPTAALGGSPRKQALDFLAKHETIERGWYGSPLLKMTSHQSEAIVAIRSLTSTKPQRITLWAGAGILEASDPLQEWKELNHKISPWLSGI